MPDWRSGMTQTFEYYVVDPGTWGDSRRLDNVKSCTINVDSDAETLGSATFDITDMIGEEYVRVYLVTVQNGYKERFALGTYLIQTPSTSFDGMTRNVTVDAYSPLLELKESMPPLGYSLLKGDNIMEKVYGIVRENVRAPVVRPSCDEVLLNDFVANANDTWSSFVIDLMANANYHFEVDEMGTIMFAPNQNPISLRPKWAFNDKNSSILHPAITLDHDLYGIPNVIEVIYSDNTKYLYSKAVNDDPNSPISTVNRGREIVYRDTAPSLSGIPSQKHIDQYAEQLLRNLSSIEYTVSYTHGYCPVRVGDCVHLDYVSAGMTNIKAKIVSQSISCTPGCPVTEKATFTTKLWR